MGLPQARTQASSPDTAQGAPGPAAASQAEQAALTTYGQMPVYFEANYGQTDPSVAYVARARGLTVLLTPGDLVIAQDLPAAEGTSALGPVADYAPGADPVVAGLPAPEPPEHGQALVRMAFVGANANPEIAAEEPQEKISNYFIGDDPSAWQTEIPNYGKVRYRELWAGIDLVFYSNAQGELEYDFVIAPGADPAHIGLAFEGRDPAVDQDGRLLLGTGRPGAELVQAAPRIYQGQGEARREVAGRWALDADGRARFDIGGYDRTEELVIDPVMLNYSSFHGGSGTDYGYDIEVDSAGSAYITGFTLSSDFPVVGAFQASAAGGYDVFVAKIKPDGSGLAYSSYLGGTADEYHVWCEGSYGITVDSSGSAYLTGLTVSSNFPVVGGFQGTNAGGTFDAFLTKISPTGASLIYSSYLGGTGNDCGYGVAADSAGNAYVTGYAMSGFPTVSPIQAASAGSTDVFVTKVNAAGSALAYSTFLGGPVADEGRDIVVDSSGAVYLTGFANTGFPTASPFQGAFGGGFKDAFVAKINAAGSALTYSSYIGGSNYDEGHAIALDSSGNAYVAGQTMSTDFPTTSPIQASSGGVGNYDAFVTKVNAAGSAKVYSTYLGGAGADYGWGIGVDPSGNAYIVGQAGSTDFPVVAPIQAAKSTGADGFVTKVNAAGSAWAYSTYLGGTAQEMFLDASVDLQGSVYATGRSGSNYPLASPFQGAVAGGSDSVITKVTTFPRRLNTSSAMTESAGPAQRASIADRGRAVAFHSPASDLVSGDANGTGDVFVKSGITATVERASVAYSGTEADGGSRFPSITPDGRYVAFMSDATNLVTDSADTNTAEDIYLKDRATGYVERISVSTAGAQAGADLDSRFAQVTPDGRYVVFQSQGVLEAGDTNGRWDVYLRDRATNTTTRVSRTSGGGAPNSASARSSISDDGRYVVFHTWASNMLAEDTNGMGDVFVRDRTLGTTSLVSRASGGGAADGDSGFPRISGDGTAVAYHSVATNLVAGDTNAQRDTFVSETTLPATERVSVDSAEAEANGQTGYASVSADGNKVAFHGLASNLVLTDTAGQQDIFVRDRTAGTTVCASRTEGSGEANGLTGSVAISADGEYIAYHALATNLIATDVNGAQDVFYTRRPTS